MTLARLCLTCGAPATASRCALCTGARKAARNAEAPRAKATVDAWIAAHGQVCPGDDEHPPHESHDLTAEHTQARGGRTHWPDAPLIVLCRAANSRRGDRSGT